MGEVLAELRRVLMHWTRVVRHAAMADGCWQVRTWAAVSGRNELVHMGQYGDGVLICLWRKACMGSQPWMYFKNMDLWFILSLVM